MYCRLEQLVDRLDNRYSVRITQQMSGSVSSLSRLTSGSRLDPDVLYVATPSELALVSDRDKSVTILCVTPSQSTVDMLIFPKRKVIIVECPDMAQLLTELSSIMFELGQQTSTLGEATARLVACENCAQLAEEGAKILENPIVITDSMMNIVDYTLAPPMDADKWRSFVNEGHLSVNTSKLGKLMLDSQSPASRASCITVEQSENLPPMIQKTITAQSYFLGYLLVPAFVRPITDEDMDICGIIGNLAASIMLGSDRVVNPIGSVEAFLSSIVDSSSFQEEEVDIQLEKLGWKPKPCMYIIVMSNNGQLIGKNLRETVREIRNVLPGTMAITHKTEMIFLWETNITIVENDDRITPLFTLLTQHSARVGLSRSFTSPASIRGAYYQARKALELGEALEPEYRVHPYERYGAYHMLEMCASYENLDNFIYPDFGQLIKYDADNDGELVKTLFSYLDNCGSLPKMSADLYIHQNTVRYRVSQITRLLRCNLADGNTFFHLCLTQRIIRLRERMEPGIDGMIRKRQ